jgi:hypothetical protein
VRERVRAEREYEIRHCPLFQASNVSQDEKKKIYGYHDRKDEKDDDSDDNQNDGARYRQNEPLAAMPFVWNAFWFSTPAPRQLVGKASST